MSFRNPYHFVPVSDHTPNSIASPEGQRISADMLGHRTHDRYHIGGLSGRLVCRLTTVGPVVIGAEQIPGENGYTQVEPFERNSEPAIPASTLRGCLSAVAEAASNSALRVLDNSYYSRRVHMEEIGQQVENFSALGLIVEVGGELRLRPLTMPTLRKPPDQGYFHLPSRFRPMFPPRDGAFAETRFKAFCYDSGTIQNAPNGYSYEHQDYWYARIRGRYVMDSNYHITGENGKLAGQNILLGLTTIGDPVHQPPEGQEDNYIRGILRVLSAPNRSDIPDSKHHEMFIPYPPEMELEHTFPITQEALDRFRRLARDRETENNRRAGQNPPEDSLPYVVNGAEPLKDRSDAYSLKNGDIVFFVPNSRGEVEKVWISQIWREEVKGTTHEFFSRVSRELLPFHKGRNCITPAEAIFGFVEENDGGSTDYCRALASRVRFSDGYIIDRPEQGCYYPEMPLRILASPKPPCPSLYFRKGNLSPNPTPRECYIAKNELNPGLHRPQGRKFYLNHVINPSLINSCRTRNEDEHQNQKNRVRPLREGCTFLFHVDFENLSRWELGLLAYAAEPNAEFHHKLGMGKPLGLGTVKIELLGVFYVDRQLRYSERGFDCGEGPRYHYCWIQPAYRHTVQDIPDSNNKIFAPEEMDVIGREILPDGHDNTVERIKLLFEDTMEPPIRTAIRKIGQPGVKRISPPLTKEQHNPEEETFRWFVRNDSQSDKQGLVPLEYGNDTDIGTLERD